MPTYGAQCDYESGSEIQRAYALVRVNRQIADAMVANIKDDQPTVVRITRHTRPCPETLPPFMYVTMIVEVEFNPVQFMDMVLPRYPKDMNIRELSTSAVQELKGRIRSKLRRIFHR